MTQTESIVRRARSPEKKQARRDQILKVARRLLASKGLDHFSMDLLAAETELARASLYRYFSSREAVLLGTYQQVREEWKDRVLAKLTPGMSDVAFVKKYFELISKDPLQILLRSRVESTIKHNISRDVLLEEVEIAQKNLAQVIDHLSVCTGLSEDKCHDLIVSFAALLIGASQLDSTPRLEREMLSPSAKRTRDALSYRRLFESNGLRILKALRGASWI